MPYKRKEDQKKNSDSWYQRNKEKVIAGNKARRIKNLEKWRLFKSRIGCAHCGLKHPAIIDFHHLVRDKDYRSVNRLIACSQFKAAYEEVKKCIPLCANCHRIHHYNEKKGVQS